MERAEHDEDDVAILYRLHRASAVGFSLAQSLDAVNNWCGRRSACEEITLIVQAASENGDGDGNTGGKHTCSDC